LEFFNTSDRTLFVGCALRTSTVVREEQIIFYWFVVRTKVLLFMRTEVLTTNIFDNN